MEATAKYVLHERGEACKHTRDLWRDGCKEDCEEKIKSKLCKARDILKKNGNLLVCVLIKIYFSKIIWAWMGIPWIGRQCYSQNTWLIKWKFNKEWDTSLQLLFREASEVPNTAHTIDNCFQLLIITNKLIVITYCWKQHIFGLLDIEKLILNQNSNVISSGSL